MQFVSLVVKRLVCVILLLLMAYKDTVSRKPGFAFYLPPMEAAAIEVCLQFVFADSGLSCLPFEIQLSAMVADVLIENGEAVKLGQLKGAALVWPRVEH